MTNGTVPLVGILMGSSSDWPVMKACSDTLHEFGVAHEARVLSAHRTPEQAADYAKGARERGMKVIVAAAGGAAHLAGVIASLTPLPVLGVPMTSTLQGLDSLLSTVQMPGGVPVGTLAIGKAGATNAAILAVRILALHDEELLKKHAAYLKQRADKILAETLE